MMLWKDIAFAAVMLLLGAAALVESVRMPLFAGGQVLSAPGLFPGMVAAVICVLSLVVLVRRLGQLRPGRRLSAEEDPDEDPGNLRIVGGAIVVVGGAILAMPMLGFIAAGMIATTGLMLVGLNRRPRVPEVLVIATVGLTLPWVVYLFFTRLFMTPLP